MKETGTVVGKGRMGRSAGDESLCHFVMSYREETRRKEEAGRRAIPSGISGTLEGLNRSTLLEEERMSPLPRSKAAAANRCAPRTKFKVVRHARAEIIYRADQFLSLNDPCRVPSIRDDSPVRRKL